MVQWRGPSLTVIPHELQQAGGQRHRHCCCPSFAGMYLGAKIGVLGANGAGKSSLMRILAGVDDKFDGKVVRAPGIR